MIKELRVRAGQDTGLQLRDPAGTPKAPGDKGATAIATTELFRRVDGLQERLAAERRRSLLVIVQGLDCSGKDATVRQIAGALDPAGSRISVFGLPSPTELSHDFLWRFHSSMPARGEIAIFNRSYYEDVTAVRVGGLVPEPTWRERLEHISAFERLIHHGGTRVLKFFLHISRAEQAERIRQRSSEADKRWRITSEDIANHGLYDQYVDAYEEAIGRTSTDAAPWYVIPADEEWYRNWAVAVTLHSTLVNMDPRPPEPPALLGIDQLQ